MHQLPSSTLPLATITVFALAQILPTFRECADGIGEQQERKSLRGSITLRSRNSRICPSATTLGLASANGRIGTVCIYQATDPEALREHARCVGMPAETITPVLDTVIICDDPVAATK